MAKVKDVLAALDDLTGGRCLKGPGDWAGGKNPWVVTKSSDIPGKAVVEPHCGRGQLRGGAD